MLSSFRVLAFQRSFAATSRHAAVAQQFSTRVRSSKDPLLSSAELVKQVSESTDLDQKTAKAAIDAVFGRIEEALTNGRRVQLKGFGTFERKYRSARKGRNPQTGEEMDIPGKYVPRFSPSKNLKDGLN